jgi:hypothetical protein
MQQNSIITTLFDTTSLVRPNDVQMMVNHDSTPGLGHDEERVTFHHRTHRESPKRP